MIRPAIIFLTILFFSCNSAPNADKGTELLIPTDSFQKASFSKNVYLINKGGCVYKDSIVVDSIGNNLYVDHKSNVYFKTYDRSDASNDLPVLISRLYNGCEGDSTYDLKNNIDLATFREIGYDYYADKRQVFFHNEMSDGGNLVIADDIDVKTFRLFPKSFYACDKKRIYYKGSILKMADRKSFKCIYKLNGKDTLTAWLSKDKKYYFKNGDICSKKDAEE